MCSDCMVEAKKCLPDVDGDARWLERHDISGSEIYLIPSARNEYWNILNGTCEFWRYQTKKNQPKQNAQAPPSYRMDILFIVFCDRFFPRLLFVPHLLLIILLRWRMDYL